MDFYQRKLYALLQLPQSGDWDNGVVSELACIQKNLDELHNWWERGRKAQDIASSSDHLNLPSVDNKKNSEGVRACHPISGQKQNIISLKAENQPNIDFIKNEPEAKKVFWWFWRFYPELFANQQQDALLFPVHMVLPDCPLHSHQSAVSALTGAMFPRGWKDGDKPKTPYLVLFSFSPVQEFIKSSRKFVDFWAGSYLLHYLSSKLCWYIAKKIGPDALIVPSLWSQEIIDALIIKEYPDFKTDFEKLQNGKNPVSRFDDKLSTSLSTAGLPNTITVLVPGKENAQRWGKYLGNKLRKEWVGIGEKVRKDIRDKVTNFLQDNNEEELKSIVKEVFPEIENNPDEFKKYLKELTDLRDQNKHGCWEWRKLWEVQLKNTWEPYWTAIPLGNPGSDLSIEKDSSNYFNDSWLKNQDNIAQPTVENFPDKFELDFYRQFNVGTWWGSIQQRLGLCLNNVKYTRNWEIPTAPGERSTISGKFSAVHPRFNWDKFREGRGQVSGSMRLFWYVMKLAYPGLFNGSEKLNALEITKRMAWVYGGVAEDLGIDINSIIKKIKSLPAEEEKAFQLVEENQIIYEQLIRFPNSSSIASARFIYDDNHDITSEYRQLLSDKIKNHFSNRYRRFFDSITHRASHVLKTDKKINPNNNQNNNSDGYYNGVMFSSKWLADDMGLKTDDARKLKELVNQAHRETGFGEGSPADWWVVLLADGDGMGDYVSGKKLEKYNSYVEDNAVDKTGEQFNHSQFENFINHTDKRMGPATHVGLNRALLDFSNRLVPYLTEQRFCGRVVYSGGDDVMVMLPIEDLPEYLLSLRSAWCGGDDPYAEFENNHNSTSDSDTTGYWYPKTGVEKVKDLAQRPHFTMGKNATMSAGVVFAHKSVPLPTVLESLWDAESGRAKKITGKDGLCFRVIYGGGNQLEALMKGKLLAEWWSWVKDYEKYQEKLTPLLYRLAEELPRRASITEHHYLFSKAARVIMDNRDENKQFDKVFEKIEQWLISWEDWVKEVIEKWAKDNLENSVNLSFEQKIQKIQNSKYKPVGIEPEDLGKILRFTAFWIDKRVERFNWSQLSQKSKVKKT
ncbi:MAG: type III-B CRISPR-associated protein Cas10/Cmr2 [Cyanobacteria bacterium P01_A01_bin.84]